MTSTIIVTGAGGVGKTTLSAALGAAISQRGRSTLVLTIDPAKRLADALGIRELNDAPTRITGAQDMWAAMLDASASWEAIVHRYADPEVGKRLLANPYFQALAERFPAAQSYAAGERMAGYIETKQFDVIIVDTPPSGGGIEFFQAPAMANNLISGKLLKWLTGSNLPGRGLLYRFTARPMLRIADTVLGGPMLSDITDFLLDLRTMHDTISVRSRTIEGYLRQATTIVATTADPTPIHETRRFFNELGGIDIKPKAIMFNRKLSESWIDAADRPIRNVPDEALRAKAKANLQAWAGEARRQSDAADEISARYHVPVYPIPWTSPPPQNLEQLRDLIADTLIVEDLGF
ncbi:MAG: ArsA-related P-loop ATPase [Acidimicrobiia bacterium]